MTPDLKADSAVVAIQPEAAALTEHARSLVVKTAEHYGTAAKWLQTIKGLLNKIEDARTRVTKPLLEAQREINAQAKEASAPLLEAERQIKAALVTYQNEQDRLRRLEQARVEEQARKERERLEAAAREAERAAREKAALERRAAEEAAAAGRAAEAAKLAARAAATETKAAEKAAALDERAAAVVAPVIQREAPKVAGLSMREVWKYEVTDESKIPMTREFYSLDHKKIADRVKSLKRDANIPGVRVYPDKTPASRSA